MSSLIAKQKILVFVRCYLPGYKSGGPIRSIANMVEALGDEFEFRIITTDRDRLDQSAYSGVRCDRWSRVGKGWVYYASAGNQGLRQWIRLIEDTAHDLLYLNSLFNPVFTVLPMVARGVSRVDKRPIVLAPRGELSSSALSLKGWKKKPYLFLSKKLGVYKHVVWHASAEEEARAIRHEFGQTAKVFVASDLPGLVGERPVVKRPATERGLLRVVFLSRIVRMKNLDFALGVLRRTQIPVRFDIWGSLEDAAYWKKCRARMRELPGNVRVTYRGVAPHPDVRSILASNDLFFLPTLGENYGHVIAESLSVGTPVLVSDRTPWRNLAADGVGWDLALEEGESRFTEAIAIAMERTMASGASWRRTVFEYAMKRLDEPKLVDANRRVFREAVKGTTSS